MGYSDWSDKAYEHISASRKSMTEEDVRAKVFRSGTAGLSPTLNPRGVKVRESRDSANHPESNAISVFFDVTGSMSGIPAMFAKEKLGGLMSMLVSKNVVPHPQVLFGAIGDSRSDRYPFQVGQFETDVAMDKCLTEIILEGGGGGSMSESYGLAHYFTARHTSTDCWEKRGKKGYLFTFGDEKVYDKLTSEEIQKIFGDASQGSESLTDLIRECETKWNVFHFVVGGGTSHGEDPAVLAHWRALLGERALKLDRPSEICETIVATIGLCEGKSIDDVSSILSGSGASAGTVKTVTNAIVPLRDSLARTGSGSIVGTMPSSGASDGTVRL